MADRATLKQQTIDRIASAQNQRDACARAGLPTDVWDAELAYLAGVLEMTCENVVHFLNNSATLQGQGLLDSSTYIKLDYNSSTSANSPWPNTYPMTKKS